MVNHGASHGIRALFPVDFNKVIDILRNYEHASNVYFTILDTKPKVAIFIGGMYSRRAQGFMTAVTLVTERGGSTEVRIVTQSHRPAVLGGDLGASRLYASDILDVIVKNLNVTPNDVVNVDYMDSSKSHLLG